MGTLVKWLARGGIVSAGTMLGCSSGGDGDPAGDGDSGTVGDTGVGSIGSGESGSDSGSDPDCVEEGTLVDEPDVSETCQVPTSELWTTSWVTHYTGLNSAVATAWFGVGVCPGSRKDNLGGCRTDVLQVEGVVADRGGARIDLPEDRIVDFRLVRDTGEEVTWTIPLAEDPVLTAPARDSAHSRREDLIIEWIPGADAQRDITVQLTVSGPCYPQECGDTACSLDLYTGGSNDDGQLILTSDALDPEGLVTGEACSATLRLLRHVDHAGYPEALAPGSLWSSSEDKVFFTLTP